MLKHDGPGLLSMAITDRDERGSLFLVTFKADHHLDKFVFLFPFFVLSVFYDLYLCLTPGQRASLKSCMVAVFHLLLL